MRLRCVWRGLLVAVALAAKESSEEASFLLLLLVGRRRGWSRLNGSCRRLRPHCRRGQRRHSVHGGIGRYSGLFADAKKFLEEITLIAGPLVAGLGGCGAVKKDRIVILSGNLNPRVS